MPRRLAYTTLIVPDYDAAIGFFTQALRFELRQDTRLSASKRWVVVAPSAEGGALLLAQPANDVQRAAIGHQGAGRVWLFLHTDDLDGDLARLQAHGAHAEGAPRQEPYGRVVVFTDPWGNRWDLIEAPR